MQKFWNHAKKIDSRKNIFDPRNPHKNYDPCKKYFDPRNPRNPRKKLTHGATQLTEQRSPCDLADSL